jgi:uncharacterized membrane protein YkvA (DUF1232 family)
MTIIEKIKTWAKQLFQQAACLYTASLDPRTPRWVKLGIALVIAYLLSPIDLIPDFIPVIGYLDDLILLPLFISLLIRAIPEQVWADAKRKQQQLHSNATGWVTAAVILFWCLTVIMVSYWLFC